MDVCGEIDFDEPMLNLIEHLELWCLVPLVLRCKRVLFSEYASLVTDYKINTRHVCTY